MNHRWCSARLFELTLEIRSSLCSVQQYWKSKIEKNGGRVANSVMGECIWSFARLCAALRLLGY